jgi:NADH:ubiquinone oxidoreductase subunit 6 (subunit J)
MRVSAALVAGFWAVLLAAATGLLAGMGGNLIEVTVYLGAIVIFVMFTTAVAVSGRRNRLRAGPWRAPPGGGTMLLLALAALLAGLGLAFSWWISICSAPFFIAAGVHELYAQRKRAA